MPDPTKTTPLDDLSNGLYQKPPMSVFDVIDQADADFYVGKALELILGHRRDAAGHAEDLQVAVRLLQEKITRLMATVRTSASYTGGSGGYQGPAVHAGGPGGGSGSTPAGAPGGASKA